MEQQNIPGIGHFRAGHFKEPIGLEEDESDLYLTFMEKSPATKAFAPTRNFGVMAWDTVDECQDGTWFLGIFAADSPDSPTTPACGAATTTIGASTLAWPCCRTTMSLRMVAT